MTSQCSDTVTSIFKCNSSITITSLRLLKMPSFHRHLKYSSQFLSIRVSRQRECRFYTAGCVNKMVVSVTGPRAVNKLGGPVIPGSVGLQTLKGLAQAKIIKISVILFWLLNMTI